MFWGLILEPERRYSQVVKKPFRVTMAALDVRASEDEPTQVIVSYQNKNFLACTLQKNNLLNQRIDLRFQEGDQISFAANGNSHVHLTGYLMEIEEGFELEEESEDETTKSPMKKRQTEQNDAPPPKKSKTLELLENADSDSDDSDFSLSKIPAAFSDEDESDEGEEVDEEEDDDEDEEGSDSDEEEDGVEEEEDEDDDEEDNENDELIEQYEAKEIKVQVSGKNQVKDKKKNQEKKQSPNKKQSQKDSKNNSAENDMPKQGEKNKKQIKKDEIQKNGSSPKKRTIEGGVVIEELKVGTGPVAKPGKFVNVYYEGRLKSNNKLFDSATKGVGFQFRLGRQEVIKGWDVGVAGMHVGGKRRITCPPNMAYGTQGSPPAIPPNSTLVFDVELKNVK